MTLYEEIRINSEKVLDEYVNDFIKRECSYELGLYVHKVEDNAGLVSFIDKDNNGEYSNIYLFSDPRYMISSDYTVLKSRLYDIDNAYQYITLVFLHEIGHLKMKHNKREDIKSKEDLIYEPKNFLEHLMDPKEAEAWLWAMRYKDSSKDVFEELSKRIKGICFSFFDRIDGVDFLSKRIEFSDFDYCRIKNKSRINEFERKVSKNVELMIPEMRNYVKVKLGI